MKLKDLEKRLSALERALASLRRAVSEFSKEATPKRRERRRPRAASARAEHTPEGEKLLQAMGVPKLELIGAEKLQQRMREHGIKPEDNAFSRGIIEMREE